MAFLMAIGLAFATEQNPTNEEFLIPGYIHEGGFCVSRDVNCDPTGNGFCKLGGVQVYVEKSSSTTCLTKMRDWSN